MIKRIFYCLLFTVYCLLPTPVLAVDITVTCPHDGPTCTMSPSSGAALFYETNWLPGNFITRSITFNNEDPDYDCPLTLEVSNFTQTPADFATKLLTEIKEGAITLYGGGTTNLDNLYHAGIITLGDVPANGSEVYDWTVTFDSTTGNYYQAAETKFDFDMVFSCGTPQTSPSPSPSSSGGDGGTTGGGGGDGTGGPGPSASPAPGWTGFVWGAATGFWETIFPPAEEKVEGEVAEIPSSPAPEVKGEQTACTWWYYLWWLALVIQLILTVIYTSWLRRRRQEGDETAWHFWLPIILLAILSQIIHWILGCECVKSRWCPWYWLFNLLILFLSFLYYRFYKEE